MTVTLPRDYPVPLLPVKTRTEFQALKGVWKSNGGATRAAHTLIYLAFQGKDYRKAFTPPRNQNKIENGAYHVWGLKLAIDSINAVVDRKSALDSYKERGLDTNPRYAEWYTRQVKYYQEEVARLVGPFGGLLTGEHLVELSKLLPKLKVYGLTAGRIKPEDIEPYNIPDGLVLGQKEVAHA